MSLRDCVPISLGKDYTLTISHPALGDVHEIVNKSDEWLTIDAEFLYRHFPHLYWWTDEESGIAGIELSQTRKGGRTDMWLFIGGFAVGAITVAALVWWVARGMGPNF